MRSLFNNLMCCFRCEDATGTDAYAGIALTANNSPSFVAGKLSSALACQSSLNQSLSIADHAGLSMDAASSFTVQAWINVNSFGAAAQTAVSKGTGTAAGQQEYALSVTGGGAPAFRVGSNSPSSTAVATGSAGTVVAGTTYWLLGEYDKPNGTIYVSVNNGSRSSAAFTSGSWDSSLVFNLGRLGSSTNPFNGWIDQVCIWKRLLTTSEKTFLYGSGTPLDFPWGVLDDANLSGGMRESLGCLTG